jgi:hypothetical protein
MTKNSRYSRPDGDRTETARHRSQERRQQRALKNQVHA